jgi:hypothetical protein
MAQRKKIIQINGLVLLLHLLVKLLDAVHAESTVTD